MRKFFTLISIVVLLASCQKELSIDNSGGGPTPTPVPTVPTKLTRLYWLDTTTTKIDTLMVQYFSYDAQKRVTNITAWQRSLTGVMERNEIVDYYYSGTDTLANKAKYMYCYKWPQQVDTVETNIFYTYNSTGQLINDSSVWKVYSDISGVITYWTHRFSYVTGKIIRDMHGYGSTSIPTDSYASRSFLQTKNGSMIALETLVDSDPSWTFDVERQFFYDGKVNPLRKTRPCNIPIIQNDDGLQFVPDSNEPQPNNITKIITKYIDKVSGTVNYTETRDYFYEYGTNGLPTILRVKSSDPAASFENKYLFVYE